MEHPIPANVTSFQFHLVGDMTLKQFAYLGSGLGLAYLTFVLLFPLSPYLAAPIIILSAISGTAFAFLPILDRPLDHWFLAFIKAVYSPTQGKWKSPAGLPPDPQSINRLQLYLTPTPLPRLSRIVPANQPQLKPTQPANQPSPLPSPEELSKLVKMAQEVQALQNKINQTEKQHDLPNLIQQTQNLYQQTSAINNIPTVRTKNPEVVVVEPVKPQKTTLLLTSQANVINGMVSDHQGNYLDGVIVIIHNKEGIPVRALKTNKLGQFTGATPLPLGTYTVTLEKEGWEFDALQITLNDEILTPLKIQPKRGEGNG